MPAEMIGCIEYDGVKPSAVRPGPAERLQDLLEHLVGAVGRPHLLAARRPRRPGQVGGEVGAQRDGVPVGVAVERGRGVPGAVPRSASSSAGSG